MGSEAAWVPLVVAAAGAATSASVAHDARASAANKQRAEQRRIRDIGRAREANLAKVREAYGVGTSANAQGNARTLADTIKDYYNAYLSQNLRSVDDQFAGASRVSRQNLARVGQLGSSLDNSTKSGNLADYLRGRQQAVAEAASAKDSLVNQLTSQRLNLENQISGGTLANPDLAGIAGQQQATISAARSQIPNTAIGNLFNTAGSTYFNGRVQEALGNQGLSAFGFSNNNNRGRIS